MNRLLHAAAAVLLLGCSDPFALSSADINGTWDFTATRNSNPSGLDCPQSAALIVEFEFDGTDDTANTYSRWSDDPANPTKYSVSGNIKFQYSRAELLFWTRVGGAGFTIIGNFAEDLTFAGILSDPIAGMDGYVFQGCGYSVAGQKRAGP